MSDSSITSSPGRAGTAQGSPVVANRALRECMDGLISPEIAVTHFLLEGADAAQIDAALRKCPPHPRLDAMRALLLGRGAQLDGLAAELAATIAEHEATGPTPPEGVARIARFFDRAVAASPEASVALYSLGDPAILAATTAETLEWLETHDLLHPDADVLDLGCGFGRIAAGLAPRCRSVLGLDVSAGMIDEARRRHGALPALRFEQTGGLDLAHLPAASRDLALAVDSFPYVVRAGASVVERHLLDLRRILRPDGALVILNLSYEQDGQDVARASAWAEQFGFALELAEEQAFRIWDGDAFVLRR